MFLHEIRDGQAVLHLYPNDCRTLARLLDSIPDHGGEDRLELVEALMALFASLATATEGQGYIKAEDLPETSLRRVMGHEPEPEPPTAIGVTHLLRQKWAVTVEGDQLAPAFAPGDLVLYDGERRPGLGEWAVVWLFGKRVVCRLERRQGAYKWVVRSSRGQAAVDDQKVLGTVVGIWRAPEPLPPVEPSPEPAAATEPAGEVA